MPPSGCYFSRDNKNYRLSGLENNRSSRLPPDRGLHSLSLDTQAVAAPRCSLLPLFFSSCSSSFLAHSLFFSLFSMFGRVLRSASSRRAVSSPSSSHLHPPSPLRSWVPHSTPPKRLPPRSFAARCPLATSSRPVAAWLLLAYLLETLLQPQVPGLHTEPLQPTDHITTLHVTHYKLPISFSLSLSSVRLARPLSRCSRSVPSVDLLCRCLRSREIVL